MADEEQPRPVTGDTTDDDVPEARPITLGLVCNTLHARAEVTERIGNEGGDLVHTVGRVRAAVDVHHPLQVGEVCGEACLHDAAQGG